MIINNKPEKALDDCVKVLKIDKIYSPNPSFSRFYEQLKTDSVFADWFEAWAFKINRETNLNVDRDSTDFVQLKSIRVDRVYFDSICNVVARMYVWLDGEYRQVLDDNLAHLRAITLENDCLDKFAQSIIDKCMSVLESIAQWTETEVPNIADMVKNLNLFLRILQQVKNQCQLLVSVDELISFADTSTTFQNDPDIQIYLDDMKKLADNPFVMLQKETEAVFAFVEPFTSYEGIDRLWEKSPEEILVILNRVEERYSETERKIQKAKASVQKVIAEDIKKIQSGWAEVCPSVPNINEKIINFHVVNGALEGRAITRIDSPSVGYVTSEQFLWALMNCRRVLDLSYLKEQALVTADATIIVVVDTGKALLLSDQQLGLVRRNRVAFSLVSAMAVSENALANMAHALKSPFEGFLLTK